VWAGAQPVLVRNYDYSPRQFEAVILRTAWNGAAVIAQSDCLWGVLDGVNARGLAVSLAFGGRRVVGEGFGVPIVLRYILEFCSRSDEAVEVLKRVPVHMAYNVTVLDAAGSFATVFVAPDRPAAVLPLAVTTNHQDGVEWQQHAKATATLERERVLNARLEESGDAPERLIGAFLRPPVYSIAYARGFGTLYTAVYHPAQRLAEYLWPNGAWRQSIAAFEEGVRTVRFPQQS
jgi:predicted choloylglycine hydrolase